MAFGCYYKIMASGCYYNYYNITMILEELRTINQNYFCICHKNRHFTFWHVKLTIFIKKINLLLSGKPKSVAQIKVNYKFFTLTKKRRFTYLQKYQLQIKYFP